MSKDNKTVGVLGGLGPMATVYFFDMVVRLTDATCDQEHVDMIISNKGTTPDRTAYIIGECKDNPSPVLIDSAKKLERYGADFLVMTCNTAHYFYNDIVENINIPMLNIMEETIKYSKEKGHKKLGILATTGNVQSRMYQNMCEKYDVEYVVLDEEKQPMIMSIIYDDIKGGKPADMDKFEYIIEYLNQHGCDGAILGCTELSILKNDHNLDDNYYIDSLEVLAKRTIEYSDKKVIDK